MTDLDIVTTKKFLKDLKRVTKRGYDLKKLDTILNKLKKRENLELKHKDHYLSGDYRGYRECHIEPDWLLIYQVFEDELILVASRTGTHSDLF